MAELHWKELLRGKHVSPNQAILVRWVSQPMGAIVAALAYRLGIGPNPITIAGLGFMLLACLPYVTGDTPGAWLLAGVLWQIGFAFDCADGQLARATGASSPFGAWLDVSCDHIRQTAMMLAILVVLVEEALPLPLVIAGVFVLMAGQTVFLHTATMLKVDGAPALEVQGISGMVRAGLRVALDTPVFLIVVCLLRPWPFGLAAYCVVQGSLLLMRAFVLGRLRLGVDR